MTEISPPDVSYASAMADTSAGAVGFEILELSANGIDFTCLATGSGPLALCLHGYPDSAWTWRHLLPELAAAGYRAVAPFNRGYAPTSLAPDGRYQAGVLGVDANALHEELGGGADAVLIGHDWGAMGAYAAASLEPDRWRRVVAAAVPVGPVNMAGFLDHDQLRMSWYIFFQLTPLADMVVPADGYAFIRRLWADWSPGFDGPSSSIGSWRACPRRHTSTPPSRTTATRSSPSSRTPALEAAQNGIYEVPTQPLLYLHGTDDGCMSPTLAASSGEYLAAPGSRSVMIDDAGHFLQLERPDVVNAEILAFLAEG